MGVRGWLEGLTQYDSPKYIRVQSVTCGCVKGFLYITVALAICFVIITYRLYQEVDEVNSSVRTSMKGVAYANNRIWDTAEYTIPMQAVNSFFVMTNIIKTENQSEQTCPEYPFTKAICSSDESCEKGRADIHSNGIQTGRCVNYNATVKTCEVRAWCPVKSMETPPEPAVLRSSEDFTVLIKNNINFPKFNYTVLNFPPNLNISCTYNKITSPHCPIFRLGDILQEANQNFSEMAVKGGIIAIEINWDCNLDSWFYDCSPKYDFHRLDDQKIKPGFHIRYAKYYELHEKERRTLFKVYGIRFDVLVFGTGRKFNSIELIKNIGSMISYFGLVVSAIEIAIFVVNCSSCSKSPFYKIYNRKKYEIVLNPRQVMYVSYVDEPHVTLIKKPLKTSLQHAQGSIVESHPVIFCHAGSCCTNESNKNHDNEESEPMPLRQRASSPDCPKWCCCGKCQPTQKYHEQLCCRRKKGQCITTSHWFQQLVLSSHTLKKALLYRQPFLDLKDGNINNQLRHLAYKQYILWRFGSFDLEDRAIIPSCCRWKIRDTYPKAVNNYTGFKME
ncbi:PREDICTED: P2X purinoceptor 7 [Charadrius vociferus]|uniref:P2X purinoceptor 7 n=1 Tax=Charadrius vociferus TaxID=50402 RepID=UPI00052175BC|nr:PREDICTED: P2X purinoceptor 7 [Charadrius vociferus]